MSFEKRVDQYVKLRDKIKEIEDRQKLELKPYKDALEQLNGMLLNMLNNTGGGDSVKTAVGTVYKKTKRSATIADAAAFRRYVIGSQNFDVLDFRANVTEVSRMIDEAGEAPPGINFTTIVDVGVRRA